MFKLYHGTSSKRGSKICGNEKSERQGFRVTEHQVVYFAEDIETARFFATEKASDAAATALNTGNDGMVPKNIAVIEFSIPPALVEALGLGEAHRTPLGEDTGMAFADIPGGSGFERMLVGVENITKFNEAFRSGFIQHRRLRFTK